MGIGRRTFLGGLLGFFGFGGFSGKSGSCSVVSEVVGSQSSEPSYESSTIRWRGYFFYATSHDIFYYPGDVKFDLMGLPHPVGSGPYYTFRLQSHRCVMDTFSRWRISGGSLYWIGRYGTVFRIHEFAHSPLLVLSAQPGGALSGKDEYCSGDVSSGFNLTCSEREF